MNPALSIFENLPASRRQALHFVLIPLLWLSAPGPVMAQTYAPGTHEIASPAGDVRVSSGFVSHLGPHSFHAYTIMFRPAGDTTWHQVPIVEDPAEPELTFVVARTATPDFTTGDALVVADAAGIALIVARLQYERTPYDDDAHVGASAYRLMQLEDESRWILRKDDTFAAPPGRSVEQVLASMQN
ncbi:hypothetical protein [Luteimonas abyssi]|uniref:hypothetical protein n=1 Tax=Luteimonas abyssi TaxID=1247514 RepID=UPI0012F9AA5A|nr:hypothetical protein [Luteimonas abyssi]